MRPGTIVFVEIPVRDLERAANFYASLFGWTFAEDPTNPRRWLFTPGKGAMGRITTERPVGSGGAKFAIAVDDLSTAMRRAIELGGGPIETVTGEVGTGLEIVDPDGNHLWAFKGTLTRRRSGATTTGVE